jgi:OFA family oxalate/formate antiporter-like MFS transporter
MEAVEGMDQSPNGVGVNRHRYFYGWIVVFAGFLSVATFGVISSYGTLIKSLESHLHASRTAISAAYSIEMVCYALFASIMGWLCDKYGAKAVLWLSALLMGGGFALSSTVRFVWQLYLFFGIAGVGRSAVFVVSTTTVARWFIRKRGLAVGTTACGIGFGLLIVPPMSEYVVRTYGWQAGFVFLGALALATNIIAGILIRNKPEDLGLQALGMREEPARPAQPSLRDFSLVEILRVRAFWVVYLTAIFCYGAEQMLVVHLVPYCAMRGIAAVQASLGLSFLGIGTVAGRIGMGWLSDRIGRVRTLMISCALQMVTTFVLLLISGAGSLYVVMLLVGFGYGGWVVMNVLVLGEYFGLNNLGKAMGVYLTDGILGAVLGPLLGGAIYDATRSYFLAISFAGVTCAIPLVLAFTLGSAKSASAEAAN